MANISRRAAGLALAAFLAGLALAAAVTASAQVGLQLGAKEQEMCRVEGGCVVVTRTFLMNIIDMASENGRRSCSREEES